MDISMIGLAVGAGIALAGTTLTPALGGILKTVTKTVIKGGLLTYQGGKAVIDKTAQCVEQAAKTFENIASEAKAELKQDNDKRTGLKKSASKRKQTRVRAAHKGAHPENAG
jgi:hypothetical protein